MSFQRKYTIEMDHVQFSDDFCRETTELLKQAAKKKERTNVKNRKYVKILAAAAALAIFSLSAFAVVKFVIPQQLFGSMKVELENLQAVVDVDNADPDSVRTMQKTFSNGDFSMTFEAIAKGKALRRVWHFEHSGAEQQAAHSVSDILNNAINSDPERQTVDSIYAIFTVRRNDGGATTAA